MKINEKLNLVVPVDTEQGTIFVHAQPISPEVFEANFLLISKTFSALYTEGVGFTAGPRIAKMMMKDVAARMDGAEDGKPNEGGRGAASYNSLVMEMRRLSSVVAPGPAGWETVPLQEAIEKNRLSRDDASEVENAIVFFIVASAMHRRSQLDGILDGAVKLWDAQTTSLNCTGYAASLLTSTEAEISAPKELESSVPQ